MISCTLLTALKESFMKDLLEHQISLWPNEADVVIKRLSQH